MRGRIVRLAIFFEGGLLVVAWGLGWLLESPLFEQVYLRWEAIAWGIVATFPPLLGAWWCAHTKWGPFLRLMREVEERLIPLFADCSRFELAVISLLAGLGEEGLFRGVIQTALADGLGPWGALVVTSVLFGLGHLITPTYAVLAGLIGLYLGGLLMAYGNLLAVVVAHALYDFLALIYLIGRQKQQAKGNRQ
ncbi:MAG: CPBP family intramembrane metalloprotease [Deltaproteobacteria bacterium]|nr:CPBP family intramembrane metalloprotease [Deltaproteobacteria bacterium]